MVDNVKCPKCDMVSRFNVLMGPHKRKHLNNQYTAEDYKRDLLEVMGRHQKICPVCNEPTVIPKGESEYPQYHHQCYYSTLKNTGNPNYKNALKHNNCHYCNKEIIKFQSQLQGNKVFCSARCSSLWYRQPENQTQAIINANAQQKIKWKEINSRTEVREKRARSIAAAFSNKKSKLEIDIYNAVKRLYPDALSGQDISYYNVDILIPSMKHILEVQGDYWHSKPKSMSRDISKYKHLTQLGYKVSYIWEHQWKHTDQHKKVIERCLSEIGQPVRRGLLLVVTGAFGRQHIGPTPFKDITYLYKKDYVNDYSFYDHLYDDLDKPIILETNTGTSNIIRRCSNRLNLVTIYIKESDSETVNKAYDFVGNKDAAIQYIQTKIYAFYTVKTAPRSSDS